MSNTYTTDSPEWQALCAGFMTPDIYFGGFFLVETSAGTECIPADVIGRTCSTAAESFADYCEGSIDDPDALVEYREGWLARLSAPGYMDCTDWSHHETEADAVEYLVETYGD